MYEVARYTDVNAVGTATLLDLLARRPVEKLLVASSMSIYGEGMYRTADGDLVPGPERSLAQLKRGDWDLLDGEGRPLSRCRRRRRRPARCRRCTR